MEPVNWLLPSSNVSSTVAFEMESRITPVSLLFPRYNICRFGSFWSRPGGRLPERLFEVNEITTRDEMLNMDAGIEPLKAFEVNIKVSSC